jgi:hypothetical protein
MGMAEGPQGQDAAQPVVVRRVSPWIGPAVATGLALLVLLLLLIPGVLICDGPGFACAIRGAGAADANSALQKEVVTGLEEQLRRLRAKLAQPAVCSIDDYRGGPGSGPGPSTPQTGALPPGAAAPGPTPPGQSGPAGPAAPPGASGQPNQCPPNQGQANPAAPPAANPNQAAAPPAAPGTPLSSTKLLAVADQATVLVIVPAREGDGLSTGTAFFINERQLVTNNHVVEAGNPDRIFVVNAAIGRLQARVVAATEGSRPGSKDFAVLEVSQPVRIKPFDLAMKVRRLQAVTSAGYPGMILNTDPTYRKLLQGTDPNAIPALVPSAGVVAAVQRQAATEVIVHSATLYPGNSGGPLLDNCAGVVGVNTFIMADKQLVRGTQYALASSTLASFLTDKGIRFNQAPDCSDQQADPPAPAPR